MVTPPEELCWKFREPDQKALSMIINEEIWFSHPDKFNDPFDPPGVNKEYIEAKLKDISKNINLDFSKLPKDIPGMILEENSKEVYFCTNKKRPDVSDEPYLNNLMWSHYANSHTGCCIGISAQTIHNSLFAYVPEGTSIRESVEIAYSQSELESIYQQLKQKLAARDMCLTGQLLALLIKRYSYMKSEEWAYEQEYRFALFANRPGRLIKLENNTEKSCIESIIFGLDVDKDFMKSVMQYLEDSNKNIPLWQMKRADDPFKLDIEKI